MKTQIKTNIIPFKEFRMNAKKYIDALEKGASFMVVKRSHPIFRLEPVGEQWETIVDFTSVYPKGIPAKELLKYLRKNG